MSRCIEKGCGSYAINEDTALVRCDKCYYKVALREHLRLQPHDDIHEAIAIIMGESEQTE